MLELPVPKSSSVSALALVNVNAPSSGWLETAKSLSPYRQFHFSTSGALWGYAEGLDTNVQKLPMTCWPDHPPFGNQKRF